MNKLWGKNWSNQVGRKKVGQTKLVEKIGQPKLVGPVVKKPVAGASTRELRKWWVPAGRILAAHLGSSSGKPCCIIAQPSTPPIITTIIITHSTTIISSSSPNHIQIVITIYQNSLTLHRHHHYNQNCHNGRPEKLFPRRTFA